MVFQPCSWWLKECHWTLGEVWGVQHVRPAEEPCGGCPALPVWSNPVPHRELQTPGHPWLATPECQDTLHHLGNSISAETGAFKQMLSSGLVVTMVMGLG